MKKQNITSVNMDEILGGGTMKDIINRTNDDLFSSLNEEKQESRIHEKENTKEEIPEKETRIEEVSRDIQKIANLLFVSVI